MTIIQKELIRLNSNELSFLLSFFSCKKNEKFLLFYKNWRNSRYILTLIELATFKIELAIFQISLDLNINNFLYSTQITLEHGKEEIYRLLNKNRITENFAAYLLQKISLIQEDIETVKNSL